MPPLSSVRQSTTAPEMTTMNTLTHRLLATLASTLVLCSTLALPTTVHASHGIKCGWVLVSQTGSTNVYNWLCSVGH